MEVLDHIPGKRVQSTSPAALHSAGKPVFSLEDNRSRSVIQKKENRTGLPDNLKSGAENLSGHSMNDVFE